MQNNYVASIQRTLPNPNGLGPEPVQISKMGNIVIWNGQPYDFQLTNTKITMNILNMPVQISEGSDYEVLISEGPFYFEH